MVKNSKNKTSYQKLNFYKFTVINRDSNLSYSEKFYLTIILIYDQILSECKSTNFTKTTFSAGKIQTLLNISRRKIFSMQKKLEKLGYINITRSKDGYNRHNINQIFINEEFFNTHKEFYSINHKLYTPITTSFFKFIVFNKQLSCLDKWLFFHLFILSHRNSIKNNYADYQISLSMKNIVTETLISKGSIITSLNKLNKLQFISKQVINVRNNNNLFEIESLNNNKFNQFLYKIRILDKSDDKINIIKLVPNLKNNKSNITPTTAQKIHHQNTKNTPPIYNYKNINKKLDYIDNNSSIKSSYFKNKNLNILSDNLNQKNINTNKFINDDIDHTSAKNIKITHNNKNKTPYKLTDFYPLSIEECEIITNKSKREFNNNSLNEILLSLSHKLSNKYFTFKNQFYKYFAILIKHEKRSEHIINQFEFKAKMTKIEKSDNKNIRQKAEKYLQNLENDTTNSREMHFKKKIAGIFSPIKAFNILSALTHIKLIPNNQITSCKQNINSFINDEFNDLLFDYQNIQLFFNKSIKLTQQDQKTLLNQAQAVYKISDLEIVIDNKYSNLHDNLNNINQEKFDDSYKEELLMKKLSKSNRIWDKICIKLIKYYGINVYINWFSKLSVIKNSDQSIILDSKNSFILSYIKNNYLHTIQSINNNVYLSSEI